MSQEFCSGSGVKRCNLEALRRADAEVEKALKRAKVLEERRAAKRASATPMDELEEFATNAEVSAESFMIAAEAVLTETRETLEVLRVSALQQAHEMSHRPETTAESFFHAHKDMTVTSKEQGRQKKGRFPGEHESLRRGVRGRVACWNTRHVRPLGGHNENSNNVEIQVQMKVALRQQRQYTAPVCSWQGVSTNEIRNTKLLWQTTHKLVSTLKSAKANSCMHSDLKAGTRRF